MIIAHIVRNADEAAFALEKMGANFAVYEYYNSQTRTCGVLILTTDSFAPEIRKLGYHEVEKNLFTAERSVDVLIKEISMKLFKRVLKHTWKDKKAVGAC